MTPAILDSIGWCVAALFGCMVVVYFIWLNHVSSNFYLKHGDVMYIRDRRGAFRRETGEPVTDPFLIKELDASYRVKWAFVRSLMWRGQISWWINRR